MSDNHPYHDAIVKELESYYAENFPNASKYLAHNIPGKLLKMGILTMDMSKDTAIDKALTYASKRQTAAAKGLKNPGDIAANEMLKVKDEKTVSETQGYPTYRELPDFPIVSFTEVEMPMPDGSIAIMNWTVRGYTAMDVFEQWQDFIAMGGKIRRKVVQEDSYEGNTIPKRPRNDLDDYFDNEPQKPAQPKGNTQPANNGNDAKTYEISGVEVIKSQNNKIGYKFLRTQKDANGNLKQTPIMPGNKAEYRSGTAEVVLKALGFTAEGISALEIGDKKNAKNRGVMAEYELQDNPQNPAHPVTQVIAYHLPDGKVIK